MDDENIVEQGGENENNFYPDWLNEGLKAPDFTNNTFENESQYMLMSLYV